MDVNFEYYKIFYYVAKYHNFTKAAQALNNSQPNITRAMNCLEQQLNTTLFIRTNRGVQLTPEGRGFIPMYSVQWSSFRQRKRSWQTVPGFLTEVWQLAPVKLP